MQTQVNQLRNAAGRLPRRAQLAILGVAVLTLLFLVLVVRTATHTTWTTVATDLRPENAAKAQKELEGAKIKNQLGAGATSLQVPADQESQARAALATAGIATGAGGHTTCEDSFGSSGSFVASTSAQQAMKQQTCLQNEIANGVEGIDGVESAAVTLVMPSTELFSAEQMPATASINVNTGGRSLEQGQVRAITKLAANSVKNLKPENVAIVDESGKLLTEDAGGASGGLTESQMKLRVEKAYALQTEAELTMKLQQIAGADNVTVISNPELDMDKVREEFKDFGGTDNAQGPIAAQDSTAERLNKPASATGGVVGTGPNVNTDSTAGDTRYGSTDSTGASTPNYDNTADKITYSNDQVARAVDKAPGTVKRHRISVVVDEDVPSDTANAVKNAVQAWMGGNAVDSLAFAQVDIPEAADVAGQSAAVQRWAHLANYIKWAILGLGMIGLAFFLRRTLEGRTQELLNPAEDMLLLESGFDPIPLRELEAAVAAATSVDSQKRQDLQRKVERIAIDKPDNVAQQLRGWLREGDVERYGKSR